MLNKHHLPERNELAYFFLLLIPKQRGWCWRTAATVYGTQQSKFSFVQLPFCLAPLLKEKLSSCLPLLNINYFLACPWIFWSSSHPVKPIYLMGFRRECGNVFQSYGVVFLWLVRWSKLFVPTEYLLPNDAGIMICCKLMSLSEWSWKDYF